MIDKNTAFSESAHSACTSLSGATSKEIRNKRMQIVVKPSTFMWLEQLKQQGVIKSKNDLINNFLENFVQHYAEDVHRKDDQ